MKKIILLFIIIISYQLTTNNCVAQDIHLSQFVMTPLLLNPSVAGKFGGDQRVILNYRDQWSSVGSPFKTFGFSFDTPLGNKNNSGNFFGVGLSAYRDKAGDGNLGLTIVNLSLSYNLRFNRKSYLSAGLQGGIVQSSIDVSKIQFDSQFDGSGHNSSLSSGEEFSNTSFIKPDFSAGVSYTYGNGRTQKVLNNNGFNGRKLEAGLAIHHVNRLKSSFLNQNNSKLNFRYVAHFNSSLPVSSTNVAVQPSAIFELQQNAYNLILGSYIRYTLKEKSKFTGAFNGAALSLGAHYRLNDAFIPSLIIESGKFSVGLSYDINVSGLTAVSNGMGGFEISLKFISPTPFGRRKSAARFF
jgi:type IX secretion system PorP/SprF family membrane protein